LIVVKFPHNLQKINQYDFIHLKIINFYEKHYLAFLPDTLDNQGGGHYKQH